MVSSAVDRSLIAVLLASAAFALPTAGHAQAAAGAKLATANTDAEEIIVLGTRRTDRTVTTSASPIDVIGAAELQTVPSANVLDVIKNIVPSFFVGQNTISDASSFVRSPTLRGLPADEVLVFLNGKRFNRSALVQVYSGGDTGLSYGSQGRTFRRSRRSRLRACRSCAKARPHNTVRMPSPASSTSVCVTTRPVSRRSPATANITIMATALPSSCRPTSACRLATAASST